MTEDLIKKVMGGESPEDVLSEHFAANYDRRWAQNYKFRPDSMQRVAAEREQSPMTTRVIGGDSYSVVKLFHEERSKERGLRPLKTLFSKHIEPIIKPIMQGKPDIGTFAGTMGISQKSIWARREFRSKERWRVSLYPKGGNVDRAHIIFYVADIRQPRMFLSRNEDILAKVYLDEPGFEKRLEAASRKLVTRVKEIDKAWSHSS